MKNNFNFACMGIEPRTSQTNCEFGGQNSNHPNIKEVC